MPERTASKQVGALWKHTAKQGDTGVFLSGTLDLGVLGEVPIVVFKNTRKTKDNQPDYRIVLSSRPTAKQNEEPGEAEAPEEL